MEVEFRRAVIGSIYLAGTTSNFVIFFLLYARPPYHGLLAAAPSPTHHYQSSITFTNRHVQRQCKRGVNSRTSTNQVRNNLFCHCPDIRSTTPITNNSRSTQRSLSSRIHSGETVLGFSSISLRW